MSPRRPNVLEYRIIAGALRGKKIVVPDLGATRPPLTRLRRSLFDFLQPYLQETHFLDLFSGTGSYLFEAISRGAKTATGVEIERRLVAAINETAKSFGVGSYLQCLCADVFRSLVQFHVSDRRFDIITMAPPQYKGLIDKTLAVLQDHPILASDGMIICQHDTIERIDCVGYKVVQQRKYGNTTFTVLEGR